MWIEQELNGYDIKKFKSFGEQEKKLPENRKISLLYFHKNNNPVVGLTVEDAEILCITKLPNPVSWKVPTVLFANVTARKRTPR